MDGRHTSDNLCKALYDLVSAYVKVEEIIEVVTDSANVMKAMKREFVRLCKTAFSIACVLHVLNLVIKAFPKADMIKAMATPAIEVASFFNKSYHFCDLLDRWGALNGLKGKIITFSQTRWFGIYDTCSSNYKYRTAFMELFDCETEEGKEHLKLLPKNIRTIILDDHFMVNVKLLHI